MDDLISRESALEALGDIHPLDYNAQAYAAAIKRLPAVNAVPVRHGRWMLAPGDGRAEVCCSRCKKNWFRALNEGKWLYCPNCGAKMDA